MQKFNNAQEPDNLNPGTSSKEMQRRLMSGGPDSLADYIRHNCCLCLHRKSDYKIVKRPYLDLELYILVRICDDYGTKDTFCLSPGLLLLSGLSAEEAWKSAIANSKDSYEIFTISGLIGIPFSESMPMYAITTGYYANGAAALYFPSVFHAFCKKYGETECYILPSSTEELIVIPKSKSPLDVLSLIQIVETVNAETIPAHLQLNATVYRYTYVTNQITVAAQAERREA